jgi:arylsulfatase A-like enzyme
MSPPRQRRRSLAVAFTLVPALLLAALLVASCRLPIQRGRWNVVVVLVDTLRADHLGAYGYGRPTSPSFDALAAESYLFTDARAQSSCTFPSVNSLLTSRHPARFLGQPGGAMGIPAQLPSLAEILAARGFATAAVSASPVVRKSPTRFNPGGGYDRGFTRFDEECLWKDAACVTRRAFAIGERLREPFFLYLHYLDPHGPYDPPQPFRKQLRLGRTQLPWALRGDPNPLAKMLDGGEPVAHSPRDVRFLMGLYDGEIGFFDSHLGALVERLRERRLLERTILVVLSDHGESFREHGTMKHCRTVYDSEIKTPLLVRLPRQKRGERLAGPVENLDVVPTLVDLLGLPLAGQGFEGRTLLPRLEGEPPADRLSFAMMNQRRAVAEARYKLVGDLAAGKWQLFDLRADPGETRDVAGTAREPFSRLKRELEAFRIRTEGEAGLRQAEEADRRLRALGYL